MSDNEEGLNYAQFVVLLDTDTEIILEENAGVIEESYISDVDLEVREKTPRYIGPQSGRQTAIFIGLFPDLVSPRPTTPRYNSDHLHL